MNSNDHANDKPGRDGVRTLGWALALGLILRLAILAQTGGLDTVIGDELQYRQIADSLVAGDGFGWGPDRLTSIRPPLYPGLLAAIWTATGGDNLQVVRGLQIVLALLTAGVVYLIGARVYNRRIGCYAAALAWLYPSLIFFNFLMLTETLFTLLLLVFVWLSIRVVQAPDRGTALACGAALALAALTRSVLYPLPLVLCPLLFLMIRDTAVRRLQVVGLVFVGYLIVITPWAVRNTRLQHTTTIVDTMGGMNLRMGNYEFTPEDRMWDAVALTGEQSWVVGLDAAYPGGQITEGQKEKWAQREAIKYIVAHPGIFTRRALIKFADFWGLEREFIAGVKEGLFNPPRWFQVAGAAAIVGAYVLLLCTGSLGLWMTPAADWRALILLLLPIVLTTAAHTIVFGHSRYHIPLMPLFAVGAAAFLCARPPRGALSRLGTVGGVATVAVFAAIWVRQIVLVDLDRITALLQQIG